MCDRRDSRRCPRTAQVETIVANIATGTTQSTARGERDAALDPGAAALPALPLEPRVLRAHRVVRRCVVHPHHRVSVARNGADRNMIRPSCARRPRRRRCGPAAGTPGRRLPRGRGRRAAAGHPTQRRPDEHPLGDVRRGGRPERRRAPSSAVRAMLRATRPPRRWVRVSAWSFIPVAAMPGCAMTERTSEPVARSRSPRSTASAAAAVFECGVHGELRVVARVVDPAGSGHAAGALRQVRPDEHDPGDGPPSTREHRLGEHGRARRRWWPRCVRCPRPCSANVPIVAPALLTRASTTMPSSASCRANAVTEATDAVSTTRASRAGGQDASRLVRGCGPRRRRARRRRRAGWRPRARAHRSHR